MKSRFDFVISVVFLTAAWLSGLGGCASPQVVAPLPALPTPPKYVGVPHPNGLTISDLREIFFDPSSPPRDSLKECGSDFFKLREKTDSRDELRQGARELVRLDPEKYHWCFYSKLLQLEEDLNGDRYLEERQKSALDTYLFLTPVARAFLDEFQDTRYLRWAVVRYRQLSEFLFFRKVEASPDLTAELASSTRNPVGYMPVQNREPSSVLEKYGIVPPAPVAPGEAAAGTARSPQPNANAAIPTAPLETDVEADASDGGTTPLAVE